MHCGAQGKAILESADRAAVDRHGAIVLGSLRFSDVLFKIILCQTVRFSDLEYIDPYEFRSLRAIMDESVEDVQEILPGQCFTYDDPSGAPAATVQGPFAVQEHGRAGVQGAVGMRSICRPRHRPHLKRALRRRCRSASAVSPPKTVNLVANGNRILVTNSNREECAAASPPTQQHPASQEHIQVRGSERVAL